MGKHVFLFFEKQSTFNIIGRFLSWLGSRIFTFGNVSRDTSLIIGQTFDVTSLYTNVPIKETLVIIKTLMENDADLQNKTNIPPKDLLDITEFLLTKTWFLFDGTFFKQTD